MNKTAISTVDSMKKKSITWKWRRTETATMIMGPTIGGHNREGIGMISIGGLNEMRLMKMKRMEMSCCNNFEITAINMIKKKTVGLQMNRLSRWQLSKQQISSC